MVHLYLRHETLAGPRQSKMSFFVPGNLYKTFPPPLSDTIFYELFKHHRSVWNFTLLHLCPPEPSQLPIFSRVDDEGSPDISYFENTPNIQIVPSHHRAQDTRANPQKQPQV